MSEETNLSADKLAEIYIKIRDARAKLKEDYEEQDAVAKEQMDLIAEQMLAICKEQNADSIKTQAGTIIGKVVFDEGKESCRG